MMEFTGDKGMMQVDESSEYKKGTCAWCQHEGEVFRDNSLCDDCDCDVVHCSICKCHQHIDNPCRHIFKTSNLDWRGSGINGEETDVDLKKSFFALLSQMPEDFPGALRQAIASEKFHTWFIAPLIGSSVIFTLYGIPRGYNDKTFEDAMVAACEREDASETKDGYDWLASLYNNQTPQANATTIAWVDEYVLSLSAKVST
jgi:hypothetical protein